MELIRQIEELTPNRRALLEFRLRQELNANPLPERKRLVAYIVPHVSSSRLVDDYSEDQVRRWRDVHDAIYAQEANGDKTFNTAGWLDSYDSAPIPADEMREWRDGTVARILECRPDRVLEIGCGAGLLLFPIAPLTSYYLGLDISSTGLDSIRSRLDEPNVELRQQTADDFTGIEAESFDTIILNSVVQYFPSAQYLIRVLEGAWRALRPSGHIFLGDIRNLDLLETFHLTLALYRASRVERIEALRQSIRSAVRDERELVLAPAFFQALASHLPDLTGLEVQPKRGRAVNELTRFRYDVVLRRCGEAPEATPVPELDWSRSGLTVEAVCRWLRTDQPERVLIRGVPTSRLAASSRWTALLHSKEAPATAGELADAATGIEAIDIEDLAGPGYDLRLRWSDRMEAYNVLLRRGGNALYLNPPQLTTGPPQRYANDALRAMHLQQLGERLRRDLQDVLPAHMVPSKFVFLEELPRSPNGKLDRRALEAQHVERRSAGKLHQEARNDVESRLARIWEELLGCQRVGVTDNFFELGGHSLLATQLISRVRRAFAVEISLRSLFEAPTIEAQAMVIEDLLISEIDSLDEAAAQELAEDAP